MDVPATSAAPSLADLQKPKSRLARLIGWCLPDRVDGLIFLCSTMLLLALGEPILMQTVGSLGMRHSFHGIGAVFIATAGCVCGVAALAALRRLNLRVGLILMAVCVAAFAAFTFATPARLWNIAGVGFSGEGLPLPFDVFGEGPFSFWGNVLVVGAVAFLVVFIVTWVATRLIELSVSFGSGLKISRTKVLIFVAIVLLILGTIQNLFSPIGFLANIEIQTSYVETAVPILLGLIAVGAFITLPAHLLTRQIKRRWKVLTLMAIFGLSLFLVVLQQAFYSMFGDSGRFLVEALLFEFFLLSTVILTARRPQTELNEADDRAVHTPTQRRYPTIWSLIPTGLIVVLMAITLFFDVATLAVSKGRDWESAFLVKKIARQSNNQVTIQPCWGGYRIACNFKHDVSPDILTDVDMQMQFGGIPGTSISIAGLTPDVVTTNLRGQLTGSVVLAESRVTSAQLQDLVGSCPFHTSLEDVEVVDPNGTVNVGTSKKAGCWIIWGDGLEIESLFAAIAPAEDGHIHLHSSDGTCDRNELDSIVELSQKISVSINDRIFNDMVSIKYQPKLSMQNIIVDGIEIADFGNESTRVDGSDLTGWKYALGHDWFLSIGSVSDEGPFWDQGLFWDVAFGKNVNANPNYAYWILKNSLSVESTFRDHAKWFHWNFGENENQEITELFLPQAESVFDRLGLAEMAHFKSLETLSFDPLWLSRRSPVEVRTGWWNPVCEPVLFRNLAALPNLKRLDLSQHVEVADPSILARIPKIEHLQIGFAESSKTLADFSLCKQLQTLVYIGTPPIVTAQQLGTLANLKSVVIVDDGQLAVSGENAIKNLENSIPGVTVTVVPASEFFPEPPESFKKHVEERAGRIRMDVGIEKMP